MKIKSKKIILPIAIVIVIVLIVVICVSVSKKDGNDMYTEPVVTFYTEDGFEYSINETEQGKVNMPEVPPEVPGKVFTGWDKEISEIKDDTKTKAQYIDVSGEKNVFAFPTMYAYESEEIVLPLKLLGNVKLCGADLVIGYEAKVLEYIGCDTHDESLTIEADTENGLLYLRYVESSNTNGEVDLANLKFKALSVEETSTLVQIRIKEAVELNDGNEIVETEYGAVDGKINLMPLPEGYVMGDGRER